MFVTRTCVQLMASLIHGDHGRYAVQLVEAEVKADNAHVYLMTMLHLA